MKLLATAALLALSISAHAQEKGPWRAASTTARAITGDIAFATEKITINFAIFPISQIRTLQPAEVSALFDPETPATEGKLYKTSIAATTRFLKKNTLCGSDDTEWIATWVTGHTLRLALFSGPKPPTFTLDAISHTTDLCGTYTYIR